MPLLVQLVSAREAAGQRADKKPKPPKPAEAGRYKHTTTIWGFKLQTATVRSGFGFLQLLEPRPRQAIDVG